MLSLLLSDQVREHQRMRERAGVDANAQSVTPGHPAVRELAESGDVIVVTAPPAYSAPSGAGRRSTSRPTPRPHGFSAPRRSGPRGAGRG
ncbi:MAG: hypothetical protein NVS3B21_36530 [Acidimicrobiales bacterium]